MDSREQSASDEDLIMPPDQVKKPVDTKPKRQRSDSPEIPELPGKSGPMPSNNENSKRPVRANVVDSGQGFSNNFVSRTSNSLRNKPGKQRYGSVIVEPNRGSETAVVNLVDGNEMDKTVERLVTCRNVDIRFGSVDMSHQEGQFSFLWDSQLVRPSWSFRLSGLDVIDELVLDPIQLRSIKTCTNFENVLMVVDTTEEFAQTVSSVCHFVPESDEVFHPGSEIPGTQSIVLNFAKSSGESKKDLIRTLDRYATRIQERIRTATLTTAEAKDVLLQNFVVQRALQDNPQSANRTEVPKEQYNYLCLVLGLGEFEKEKCMIRISLKDHTIAVFPDRSSQKGTVLKADHITECTYDEQNLVVVFTLDHQEANQIADFLLRNTDPAELLKTSTKFRRPAVSLRLLLKKTVETKYLQKCLKALRWEGSKTTDHEPDFAFKAFPNRPEFKNLERPSIESSRNEFCRGSKSVAPQSSRYNGFSKGCAANSYNAHNVAQQPISRNSASLDRTTTVHSRDVAKPGAAISKKEPLSVSNRFLSTVATTIGNQSFPLFQPPAKRSALNSSMGISSDCNGRDVKRSKSGDTDSQIDLTGDAENNPGNAHSRPSSSRVLNGERPKIPTKVCSKSPLSTKAVVRGHDSLLAQFLRVVAHTLPADVSATPQTPLRTTTNSTVGRAGASQPTPVLPAADCIVLCDDDEEDADSGSAMVPVAHVVDVPPGAHDIFRNLHHFPEVIIGNACIRASDVYQLANGQQLGDGVVQFMIEFLRHCMNTEDQRNIHIFSYFFFQTYLGAVRGLNMANMKVLPEVIFNRVRDHTKKIDIFQFEYLVIPVLNEQHWYLAVVCHPCFHKSEPVYGRLQKTCIVIIDSLFSNGSGDRHKFTSNLIQLWLEAEYNTKFPSKTGSHYSCPRIFPKGPQQKNGVDCGVFLVSALTQFLRDKPHFEYNGNKTNKFSGRRPVVTKWFFDEPLAVEKQRLHMLHCYLTVAAVRRLFVYRDTYIGGLIEELDKSVVSVGPKRGVALSTRRAPVKEAVQEDENSWDIDLPSYFKFGSQRQHKFISDAQLSDAGRFGTYRNSCTEYVTQYINPATMTKERAEFYRLSGCRLPEQETEAKVSVQVKNLENIAFLKKNRDSFWKFIKSSEDVIPDASGAFQRMDAEQLEAQFLELKVDDE